MENQPVPSTPLETLPSASQPTLQNEQPKIKKPIARPIFLVLGLAIVLLVGAVVYDMYSNGLFDTSSSKKVTTTKVATKSAPAVYNPNPVDQGVTWLATVKPLVNLKLIDPSGTDQYTNAEFTTDDISYYQVGSDNGKDIIVGVLRSNYSATTYQFLKSDDTHYEYLTKYSEKVDKTEWDKKITAENSKIYNTLTKQAKIELKNLVFTSSSDYFWWFKDLNTREATVEIKNKYTKFETTPYGDLYLESADLGSGINSQEFVLRLNNGTATYYFLKDPKSFFKNDSVPAITWNDGSKNTQDYRTNGIVSCGTPFGTNIIENKNLADLKEAGKSNTGVAIYEFSNLNNAILVKFYNDYKNSYTEDVVSLTEYLKTRPLLVFKDPLDRLVLMNGGKYSSQAECGKPVVYLYPISKTKVSVQVDAKITVSEPDYGSGWNVTAYPDGTIVNGDGKVYDSLFWEGTGKEYPRITQGQVVARENLEATLRSNLNDLGLNLKETNDFMQFWLPKMPKNPYTRLTWFNTAQINRLAPLTINPKPETLIRIFLDFAGLNNPVEIQPQKLVKINRTGFTVVEWGGLLRK